MIGTIQANEAIKIITGMGEPIYNKLIILDALNRELTIVKIRNQHTRNGITELMDYEDFCGISQRKSKSLKNY